jgi:cysteinylglycine-S-conjugate dipeptidase
MTNMTMNTTTPSTGLLREKVKALMPDLLADHARLVRIPSVNFDGFPIEKVHEAGRTVLELFKTAGLGEARLLDVPSAVPAVYASRTGPARTPTVLLYAHYDVQPPGESNLWKTSPFEPTRRDGRIYGRGAADDKSGIIIHVGAIRAFDGKPPVNLKVVIEGEEETGRGTLEEFVATQRDLFKADVIVVADVGNWKLGEPTLTTALRGLAVVDVEVQTLEHGVHSGMFGGVAPDALIALVRMLAALHDERGNVAVKGLTSIAYDGPSESEEQYRQDAAVLPGVGLIGDGSIGERLYARPSISVIGLDAPRVQGAANLLVAKARARISARLAPSQTPEDAQQAIIRHLEAVAPWHVKVAATPAGGGEGFLAKTDGPGYAAARRALADVFGRAPVNFGQGGSIPLVSVFQRVNPKAEIIMWGAEEPLCAIHAPNESVDVGELERFVLTEAALLAGLANGSA